MAKVCCSLLSKEAIPLGAESVITLAGSDKNNSEIVEKGGMDKLIKLSARFNDDLSILQ
ncbi:hypothetical protein AHAS_Ahas06G0102700 [Arachis hypogaea]